MLNVNLKNFNFNQLKNISNIQEFNPIINPTEIELAKQIFTLKMESDEVFYKKFSLIKKLIYIIKPLFFHLYLNSALISVSKVINDSFNERFNLEGSKLKALNINWKEMDASENETLSNVVERILNENRKHNDLKPKLSQEKFEEEIIDAETLEIINESSKDDITKKSFDNDVVNIIHSYLPVNDLLNLKCVSKTNSISKVSLSLGSVINSFLRKNFICFYTESVLNGAKIVNGYVLRSNKTWSKIKQIAVDVYGPLKCKTKDGTIIETTGMIMGDWEQLGYSNKSVFCLNRPNDSSMVYKSLNNEKIKFIPYKLFLKVMENAEKLELNQENISDKDFNTILNVNF